MKYYYLFILITTTALANKGTLGTSELNSEQGIQIDCLVIPSDQKENAITNKLGKLYPLGAYQIETIVNDEVTPMAVNDQFVKPVHKHGVEGRDSVPIYVNDSLSYKTRETERLLFLIA